MTTLRMQRDSWPCWRGRHCTWEQLPPALCPRGVCAGCPVALFHGQAQCIRIMYVLFWFACLRPSRWLCSDLVEGFKHGMIFKPNSNRMPATNALPAITVHLSQRGTVSWHALYHAKNLETSARSWGQRRLRLTRLWHRKGSISQCRMMIMNIWISRCWMKRPAVVCFGRQFLELMPQYSFVDALFVRFFVYATQSPSLLLSSNCPLIWPPPGSPIVLYRTPSPCEISSSMMFACSTLAGRPSYACS